MLENKALLIPIIFSIIVALLGASYFTGGDYNFHFVKANSGCENNDLFDHQEGPCETYAPLYHLLSGIFSFHENAFFYFNIFLFAILTPLILFYYSRNWIITLLYFCASNYYWYFMDGVFPQALALILLFVLYYEKDHRIELVLIPLIILSHGSGFIASLFILFFKYIEFNAWYCTSLFGANTENAPAILYQKIGSSGGLDFGVNNILHFLFKTFPLPYLFIALKESFDNNKRTFYLIIFLILAGIIYAPRVWYLSFIIALPSIVSYYERLSNKKKLYFIVFTIVYGIIQLYLFLNFKEECTL